ncbi:hypothetical protein V5799_013625 [Amblyomma americanum]|uniref:Uncharacterized protein n=1 Tax=Amblyomma americanum TaxID=6943 RepID=A0AAQ4E5D8_AMBAM
MEKFRVGEMSALEKLTLEKLRVGDESPRWRKVRVGGKSALEKLYAGETPRWRNSAMEKLRTGETPLLRNSALEKLRV